MRWVGKGGVVGVTAIQQKAILVGGGEGVIYRKGGISDEAEIVSAADGQGQAERIGLEERSSGRRADGLGCAEVEVVRSGTIPDKEFDVATIGHKKIGGETGNYGCSGNGN